jgi:hypothetical protein
MRFHRGLRVAACLLWLMSTGSGCTSLKEVPRGEYATQPQRDHVRVVTREGLLYEFDYAKFAGDSLVGFRRQDVQGPVEEYASLGMSLDQVANLATRQVDWVRTGLIGGVVMLGVLLGAYKASQNNNSGGGGSGGGNKPPPG